MEKLIIKNETGTSLALLISAVKSVLEWGKISKTSKGPQHSFVSIFPIREYDDKTKIVSWWDLVIYATKNKESETFRLVRKDRKETE